MSKNRNLEKKQRLGFESDILNDLNIISSVVQYVSMGDSLPLRDPAVDTILRRLGLVFGSFSINIRPEDFVPNFTIPEQGIMIGFDADSEEIASVKRQILSQVEFGYKCKESHLAGYQLHLFLTRIYNFFYSVYKNILELSDTNIAPDELYWGDQVFELLLQENNSPTLTSIDAILLNDFLSRWNEIIKVVGIPPGINRIVIEAARKTGNLERDFRRAQKFGLLIDASTDTIPSTLFVGLYMIVFFKLCPQVQQIVWPWSNEHSGGDWRNACEFIFQHWLNTILPRGYRVISESEVNLKFILTQTAIELCDANDQIDITEIIQSVTNKFMSLRPVDNASEDLYDQSEIVINNQILYHDLVTSVALDLWNLELDLKISGQIFTDDDIFRISNAFGEFANSCAEKNCIGDVVEQCLRYLQMQDNEFIKKVATYQKLLPIAIRYRPRLDSRTQVVIPISLDNSLGGVFIAASTLRSHIVKSKLESGGIDIITRALTIPIAWNTLVEKERYDLEYQIVKDRELSWLHRLKNRQNVINKKFNSLQEKFSTSDPVGLDKLLRSICQANQAMEDVIDSFGAIVWDELPAWIDLEMLISKAANTVESDCFEKIQSGILVVDPPSTKYVKVKIPTKALISVVEELFMNAYKNSLAKATKQEPGRIAFELMIDEEKRRAYIIIANTGKDNVQLITTNNPDDAIVTDREIWMSWSSQGRGLDHVWNLVNENMGDDISINLFRYKRKSDNLIAVGLRLSGESSLLSFTPGDHDELSLF